MTVKNADTAMEEDEETLSTTLMPQILKCFKLAQDFPVANTPAHVYYNDFLGYRKIMEGNSRNIIRIMQSLIDQVNGNGNITDTPDFKTFAEKFSVLTDVNDLLLSRLSMAMDVEENPKLMTRSDMNYSDLLVCSATPQKEVSILLEKDYQGKGSALENIGGTRLLSAKNVVRPQSLFPTPPDNSYLFFRPLITEKPNALVPLSKNRSSVSEYPHPYGPELQSFAVHLNEASVIYEPADNPFPAPLEDTQYDFVNSEEGLSGMLEHLRTVREIAIDLEHHSYRSYLGFTCLIQVSTRTRDFVVDALALRGSLQCLNLVTTDMRITKILHGSDMDLMWLQRDFGVYMVNLVDTRQAAKLLRLAHGSLSFLLATYAHVKAQKQYQLADWRIRPLPTELVHYARCDTHYLLYIGQLLRQRLHDQNQLIELYERGIDLCQSVYTKPEFNVADFARLYHQGSRFSVRHLYAMEHLFALRDSIARKEDESVHYVLPNHMFKVLCENLPRETTGVFACCNPTPPLVRKFIHDIFRIFSDARNKRIDELEPLVKNRSFLSPEVLRAAKSGVLEKAPREGDICRDFFRASAHGNAAHEFVPLAWDYGARDSKPVKPQASSLLASFMSRPSAAGESRDPSRILLDRVTRLLSVKSSQATKMFDQARLDEKPKAPAPSQEVDLGVQLSESVVNLNSRPIVLDDEDAEVLSSDEEIRELKPEEPIKLDKHSELYEVCEVDDDEDEEEKEEGEDVDEEEEIESLPSDDNAPMIIADEKSRRARKRPMKRHSTPRRKRQGDPDSFISVAYEVVDEQQSSGSSRKRRKRRQQQQRAGQSGSPVAGPSSGAGSKRHKATPTSHGKRNR